jgi:hypothetical protein
LEFGGGLPVNLLAIAKVCGVKALEFQTLLVDGATSVRADGFAIYIKCDVGDEQALTDAIRMDGTGRSLPTDIRNRARFTIAHEIAHTFFYDMSKTPPVSKVDVRTPATLRSLETACSLAASSMLLPKRLLEKLFFQLDWLDPRNLNAIAAKALLSKSALVNRFRSLPPEMHPEGVILSIYRRRGTIQLQAVSGHYSMKQLSRRENLDDVSRLISQDLDFVLNGGFSDRVDYGPYTLATDATSWKRADGSFFVTIAARH